MQRRKTYLSWINASLKELLNGQDMNPGSDTYGCFDRYFWNENKVKYANSRFQEASLTLAWLYKRNHKKNIRTLALAGLDYLCKIQHKDGSFAELTKNERSFAATVFVSYAALCTVEILDEKERYRGLLEKVAKWLTKNDEIIFTNQEAIASTFFMKMYKIYGSPVYKVQAEKKMKIVLSNQSELGDYQEQCAYDFGYSTLTFEMLAHFYQMEQRRDILDSAKKFLRCSVNPPNLKNKRGTDWAILDGYEIFSKYTPLTAKALKTVIERFDVQHLPNYRHLCTDTYRLCWAYDHATVNIKHHKMKTSIKKPMPVPSKILSPLRRFGLHRIRHIKYLLK